MFCATRLQIKTSNERRLSDESGYRIVWPEDGGGRWGGAAHADPRTSKTAFKKSMRWAKPLLPILVFGLFCTLIGVFLGQQPPRIIQYTIDTVIGAEPLSPARRASFWLYIGIVILGQIIGSASGYWMNVAGQRLLHTLRMALYDHFQTAPAELLRQQAHRRPDLPRDRRREPVGGDDRQHLQLAGPPGIRRRVCALLYVHLQLAVALLVLSRSRYSVSACSSSPAGCAWSTGRSANRPASSARS